MGQKVEDDKSIISVSYGTSFPEWLSNCAPEKKRKTALKIVQEETFRNLKAAMPGERKQDGIPKTELALKPSF